MPALTPVEHGETGVIFSVSVQQGRELKANCSPAGYGVGSASNKH
jgi:hypothetical protein